MDYFFNSKKMHILVVSKSNFGSNIQKVVYFSKSYTVRTFVIKSERQILNLIYMQQRMQIYIGQTDYEKMLKHNFSTIVLS